MESNLVKAFKKGNSDAWADIEERQEIYTDATERMAYATGYAVAVKTINDHYEKEKAENKN